jgi:hypothetical protein
MIGEKERTTRSDKKIDCKPTISLKLKECIYRLSYITNTPVKDVGEEICKAGLSSKKVVDYLSNNFRRDFRFGNTFYMGDLDRTSLKKVNGNEPKERITIRFRKEDYETLNLLAFALDVSTSKATAILLEASILNTHFIDRFTKQYLKEKLDDTRMKELKKVLRYINKNNPYDDHVSWGSLLSFLYDEVKTSTTTMTNAINNWIDKMK